MNESGVSRGHVLEQIGRGKVIWVGGYPAHYVRQMHVTLEALRPAEVHFIYLAESANRDERSYERGQLPVSSIVLDDTCPMMRFLHVLRKLRPKALIVTGYNHRLLRATLLWSCLVRANFSFWSDTNILITLEGNLAARLVKKAVLKRVLLRARKLLYVGTRNRDFYVWLLGLRQAVGKLFFLPYPAIVGGTEDGSPKDVRGGLKGRGLRILYLGRLEPIKAVDKLLHALTLLPTAIRETVYLDICGDGSEEGRLKRIAVECGVSERVRFHGSIPSDQVGRVYANADLFVLPSEKEPWGLVVNEALSAGVPVMCPFWVGAAADLVTEGETGYVLQSNTPACIAAGIERAYRAGRVNTQLGGRGRARIAVGGWNVDGASERMVALVDEISRETA